MAKWKVAEIFYEFNVEIIIKIMCMRVFLFFSFFPFFADLSTTRRAFGREKKIILITIQSNRFNVPEPIESFKWYWIANNIPSASIILERNGSKMRK